MGSGDLNLKKSWNPALMKNREKVWKMEQEMLKEHKEHLSRDAKIHDIQSKSELLTIHQSSKADEQRDLVTETMDKTRWMYKGPKDTAEALEVANDEYLLGKKKLTSLMEPRSQDHHRKGGNIGGRFEKVMSLGSTERKSNNEKNNKDFEKERTNLDKSDPLYAIKLQEIKRKELQVRREKLRNYKTKGDTETAANRDRMMNAANDPEVHRYKNKRSKYPTSTKESNSYNERRDNERGQYNKRRTHVDTRSEKWKNGSNKYYGNNRDEDPQRYPQNYRNRS